jgi:hypothetical protein
MESRTTVRTSEATERPVVIKGRVWLVLRDNIDTDMIYHNQHLAVTELKEMGKYTFGNLKGWEDFARKAEPGDIIVTGRISVRAARRQTWIASNLLGARPF